METTSEKQALIAKLKLGNAEFVNNKAYASQRHATSQKQCPSLVVVSCSDSCCSVPVLFSQLHLGQIFEVKTAGNVVDSSCVESVKYALQNIEPAPKLVVILGHTKCGAVEACCKCLTNHQ